MTNDGPHRPRVLLIPRLIQPIFLSDVLLDGGRDSLFASIEISWSEPDKNPGNGDNNEDSRNRNEQATDDETEHQVSSSDS